MVADHLSRPVKIIRHDLEKQWLGKTRDEIRDLQRNELLWRELIEYLEGGALPRHRYYKSTLDQFVVEEEILYKVIRKSDGSLHDALVVPQPLRKKALEESHIKLSGHLGIYSTIKQTENYWNNMLSDVKKYVTECLVKSM